MGETRVDLLHLLEDLRDAYTDSLEETILTEIVANSLDSGASRIQFQTDSVASTLTVLDNGSGMQRRELAHYHDIAASAKMRGQGIGFAGVGIKLGLLVCDEVVTETRRASSHVATRWHLATRHKAPWKWMTPPGLVSEQGTAVQLKLKNPLSPLLDGGFVEAALRRHYEPLLDPAFDPILAPIYRHDIQFEINDRLCERRSTDDGDRAPIEVRLARKRKPSALGVMFRERDGLAEDRRGIAISTYGKIIKRGWDWLGIAPAAPELFGGTIEVPELAGCLTLNKGDFIRTGERGATYLGFRRAIQSIVSRQLAEWGDGRDPEGHEHRRVARPLERDLENVLVDLADEFPMLASLVEHRLGGQRRLPIGRPGGAADTRSLIASSVANSRDGATGGPESRGETQSPNVQAPTEPREKSDLSPATEMAASNPNARRPARYGLAIQFESRTDDPEIARLLESTVWVNDAHPAFRRAAASHSEGYHLALSVAMALAPLAVPAQEERGFVTAFLARWGEALEQSGKGRKTRSRS
jgi:hypothetical protein